MSNMNESKVGTMRRGRIGMMAALIATMAVLAGCSAGADSGYDSAPAAGLANEGAAYDAGGDFAEGGGAVPGDGSVPTATDNRSLIVTGSLYMTVDDPIAAADAAAEITKRNGGRVDARDETAPRETGSRASAEMTLRVPSAKLDAVVDELDALGTTDYYNTSSIDVSTEVIDLDARISTLRESTARIEGLLKDAQDIDDIIALEDELASRQATLQSLEAQKRGLDDQVAMSTLNVSFTTEPIVVEEEDDSPKNFVDGLKAGWNGLVGFATIALTAFGILLPWFAVIALVVLAIVWPLRKRRANRPAAPPAHGQVFAAPPPPAPPAE